MPTSSSATVSEYEKELSRANDLKEEANKALMVNSRLVFAQYERAIRKALDFYDKASKLSDSSYICHLEKAGIYLDLGEFKNACQSLFDAERLVSDSNSDSLLLALSERYISLGHPEIALEKLDKIALGGLSSAELVRYFVTYAKVLLNGGDSDRAIKILKEGIRKVNNNQAAHVLYYLIGIAQKKMPYTSKDARLLNIQKSIENYVHAIDLLLSDPDFIDTEDQYRLPLGKYYRVLGKQLKELDAIAACESKICVEAKVNISFKETEKRLRDKYEKDPDFKAFKPTLNAQFCQIAAYDLYKEYPVLKQHVKNEYAVDSDSRIYNPTIYPSVVKSIMESESMKKIEEIVFENKAVQKNFLTERYRLQCQDVPTLHILQHWNSYTPIISEDDVLESVRNGKSTQDPNESQYPNTSKGGGYYINTGGVGVVIDPGFDFIKNFKEAGFCFNDIDVVLLTHAHNDHTTDLESLLTLLHKYNESVKGDEYSNEFSDTTYSRTLSKFYKKNVEDFNELVDEFFAFRRKKIKIFMTASTFKKYAPLLDLSSKMDYQVEIVNKNSRSVNLGGKMSFKPIFAKHFDLISDKESVGFVFSSESCCLVYTGDTGFNDSIKKTYKELLDDYPEDCFEGSKCQGLCKDKTCVLLAHIGGFKQCENHAIGYSSYKKNYENHLGRLGLAQLANLLNPSICIVSEFGDEFRSHTKQNGIQIEVSPRIELCSLYKLAFKQVEDKEISFIPADIGLILTVEAEPKVLIGKNDSDQPIFHSIDDFIWNEDEFGYIKYETRS